MGFGSSVRVWVGPRLPARLRLVLESRGKGVLSVRVAC